MFIETSAKAGYNVKQVLLYTYRIYSTKYFELKKRIIFYCILLDRDGFMGGWL